MDGHTGRAGEQLETAEQNMSPEAMELFKAELLATVSHELRSPLASIKGYAGTLLRHESRISREERHEFLVAIAAASDHLERIIDRLLEISQLETGTISIERSPVDVVVYPVQVLLPQGSALTRMVEVCVCDYGLGIPPEHLEWIFDRFHRVDTRLTREVNGLGLGLTICKHIVKLHDGMIWAESCPSGGSAFHVRLPMDGEEKSLTPLVL